MLAPISVNLWPSQRMSSWRQKLTLGLNSELLLEVHLPRGILGLISVVVVIHSRQAFLVRKNPMTKSRH